MDFSEDPLTAPEIARVRRWISQEDRRLWMWRGFWGIVGAVNKYTKLLTGVILPLILFLHLLGVEVNLERAKEVLKW